MRLRLPPPPPKVPPAVGFTTLDPKFIMEERPDMAEMYRQGDVLLWKFDESREVNVRNNGAYTKITERVSPRIVLALGEQTGHAHVIDAAEAGEYLGPNGDRVLDVYERAFVRHEEHAPVELPKGLYKVVLQREFQPPTTAESTEPVAPRRVID